MEKKSFSKTIKVQAFTDKNGLPTCAIDFGTGEVCKFYRTTRFGCTETCVFIDNNYNLNRRDKGEGSLIPCKECPLWDMKS